MDTQIICGDCVEVMRGFQDECIDLTVTSPPYDNMRTYHGYNFDYEATFRELYRVTKRGGVCVWIVSDQTKNGTESCTSFKQALYARECGFNLHDTMIWCKDGGSGFGSHLTYTQNFDYMFIFSKSKPKAINLIKDRVNKCAGKLKAKGRERRHARQGRKYDETYIIPEYSRRNNWWLINTVNRDVGHPAAFPVQLVNDHIISWSNVCDTVLDPFMGSGTTGVACINTDRNFIGIEIDSEYCELARKRIDEAKAAKEAANEVQ